MDLLDHMQPAGLRFTALLCYHQFILQNPIWKETNMRFWLKENFMKHEVFYSSSSLLQLLISVKEKEKS